jgi:hypothetical protein
MTDILHALNDGFADLREDMREVKAILTRMEKTIAEIEKAVRR